MKRLFLAIILFLVLSTFTHIPPIKAEEKFEFIKIPARIIVLHNSVFNFTITSVANVSVYVWVVYPIKFFQPVLPPNMTAPVPWIWAELPPKGVLTAQFVAPKIKEFSKEYYFNVIAQDLETGIMQWRSVRVTVAKPELYVREMERLHKQIEEERKAIRAQVDLLQKRIESLSNVMTLYSGLSFFVGIIISTVLFKRKRVVEITRKHPHGLSMIVIIALATALVALLLERLGMVLPLPPLYLPSFLIILIAIAVSLALVSQRIRRVTIERKKITKEKPRYPYAQKFLTWLDKEGFTIKGDITNKEIEGELRALDIEAKEKGIKKKKGRREYAFAHLKHKLSQKKLLVKKTKA